MGNYYKYLVTFTKNKMAQLTLEERALMANNGLFQQRLIVAIKKTANYWKANASPLNNSAMAKRKAYAEKIQSTAFSGIQAYSEFLMSVYNTDPPILSNGQLADSELEDSTASALSFDIFAGVQPQDI